MFNSYISVDQQNQERQASQVDSYINSKTNPSLNTDLYSAGFFDGLIGEKPCQPEQHSYWEGYQTGHREYWAKKLGVTVPTKF